MGLSKLSQKRGTSVKAKDPRNEKRVDSASINGLPDWKGERFLEILGMYIKTRQQENSLAHGGFALGCATKMGRQIANRIKEGDGFFGEWLQILKVASSTGSEKGPQWELHVKLKPAPGGSKTPVDGSHNTSPSIESKLLKVITKKEFTILVDKHLKKVAGKDKSRMTDLAEAILKVECKLDVKVESRLWGQDVWDAIDVKGARADDSLIAYQKRGIAIKLVQEQGEEGESGPIPESKDKLSWLVQIETFSGRKNYPLTELQAANALKSPTGSVVELLVGAKEWDREHKASLAVWDYLLGNEPKVVEQIKAFYEEAKILEALKDSESAPIPCELENKKSRTPRV